MEGLAERTTQSLEDMLRPCFIIIKGSWDEHFSLVEYSYNNSYYSTTSMAPLLCIVGDVDPWFVSLKLPSLHFFVSN